MKTRTTRLMTRVYAALIAAAGVSFSIGGTLFLMSIPAVEYATAVELATQSAPLVVARQD
ncbi:hypothetical protein OPU71_02555 [Niveibacterium sp. 24ML]|uniref:hypothetical protein n=1 Tax=Niveibacterium sp. 24ML TaxID=2985512 RepID=UPI00226F78B8|nr:hypothetical protein [Niveibacterium sp. 24ML]MCX9155002.1 hypothetical protein [Niveibacterium sp. 24ML]